MPEDPEQQRFEFADLVLGHVVVDLEEGEMRPSLLPGHVGFQPATNAAASGWAQAGHTDVADFERLRLALAIENVEPSRLERNCPPLITWQVLFPALNRAKEGLFGH